ncbi:uncharacterized protein LOC125226222 [Leguminivora glycinivorella]|uniref:uncharacterized protein LOC125226222 n=1 Tax=Leguminivora glycinivorella TaxID=1035111 RepID=UPI00200C1E7D|nr:uncharacterized protein LOC125226222 [Leguminivora glycinivorella]
MWFKIIHGITFITLCSGAPPTYPEATSNVATYSHSYVREDVPLSYKYSATHHYAPQKAEENILNTDEDTPNRNEDFAKEPNVSYHDYSFLRPLSNRTIQFAPVMKTNPNLSPREDAYSSTPILYTSVDPNSVTDYGKFEINNHSSSLSLKLEPERISNDTKNISPTTYKPHINHDVKILHSHHSHLRPNFYRTLYTEPLVSMSTTPIYEMAALRHLAIFHKLQQQLDQHLETTTTENPKLSHVLNLGVRILPKQGTPFMTVPHELSRNTPFQPIPRIAYHNKFNYIPEKLGRPEMYSRYLNNSIKHLNFNASA